MFSTRYSPWNRYKRPDLNNWSAFSLHIPRESFCVSCVFSSCTAYSFINPIFPIHGLMLLGMESWGQRLHRFQRSQSPIMLQIFCILHQTRRGKNQMSARCFPIHLKHLYRRSRSGGDLAPTLPWWLWRWRALHTWDDEDRRRRMRRKYILFKARLWSNG